VLEVDTCRGANNSIHSQLTRRTTLVIAVTYCMAWISSGAKHSEPRHRQPLLSRTIPERFGSVRGIYLPLYKLDVKSQLIPKRLYGPLVIALSLRFCQLMWAYWFLYHVAGISKSKPKLVARQG
jgi:hypothetical protein